MALVAVVLIYPLTGLNLALRWRRDFGPQGELVLNQQVADWIHRTYPSGPPALVTTMPALHFVLGTDPFASHVYRFAVVAAQQLLPPGTVLVWDSRIAVIDDGVTLAQLRANPRYALQWERGMPRNLTKPHANDSTHVAVLVQRP